MSSENLLVFTGNANRPLAQAVCRELGVPLGKALVGKFSDGEVQVEIEENVRGQDVFVIQPTSRRPPSNFMELLVLIDALKRASAAVGDRGGAVLRLRPPGSPAALGARADHGEGRGEDDLRGGRRPRVDGRPARRPDPGFLRHAGGQRLCLAAAAGGHLAQPGHGRPDRGVAGRRRRGARAGDREAPRRCRPGDHRQAPPEGRTWRR